MSAVLQKLKRFKLRALHNQKKFGVAGRNCEEVLRKGCLHLQVPRGPGGGALRLQVLPGPRSWGPMGWGPLLAGAPGRVAVGVGGGGWGESD